MDMPKMILFDYGDTLICEPGFSPYNGNTAVFPYISENPHNISPEEYNAYVTELFDDIRALRGELIDVSEENFLRYVLEHFDIKLSITMEEAQWLMWNGMSGGQMTPGADRMLERVRKLGIRTGVISNLCWTSKALTRRLKQFFPEHEFDFVITSSDYIFRKPEPHIFDIAVRKSGLSREEIWFCGNDIQVDVEGAHNSGLFPVLYDDRSVPGRFPGKNDGIAMDYPHMRISSWDELF